MVERIPTDHWDLYFLMQHYDLPTRLLDWSFSSLVGLFFAVYDYRMLKADWTRSIDDVPDTDAAVWMMDSETLNRNTLGSTFSTVEPIPSVSAHKTCNEFPNSWSRSSSLLNPCKCTDSLFFRSG